MHTHNTFIVQYIQTPSSHTPSQISPFLIICMHLDTIPAASLQKPNHDFIFPDHHHECSDLYSKHNPLTQKQTIKKILPNQVTSLAVCTFSHSPVFSEAMRRRPHMILHTSALCLISYLRTVCSLSRGLGPFTDATRKGQRRDPKRSKFQQPLVQCDPAQPTLPACPPDCVVPFALGMLSLIITLTSPDGAFWLLI